MTSDLDEYSIAGLSGAPVDGYGVGTSLVTGSGSPTCGFVYKLVARALSGEPGGTLLPVAKKSSHKMSVGGRKWAVRRCDARGNAVAEVLGVGELPALDSNERPLLVPLVSGGEVVGRETLDDARARHERAMAELPVEAGKLSHGEPAIDTEFVIPDPAAAAARSTPTIREFRHHHPRVLVRPSESFSGTTIREFRYDHPRVPAPPSESSGTTIREFRHHHPRVPAPPSESSGTTIREFRHHHPRVPAPPSESSGTTIREFRHHHPRVLVRRSETSGIGMAGCGVPSVKRRALVGT